MRRDGEKGVRRDREGDGQNGDTTQGLYWDCLDKQQLHVGRRVGVSVCLFVAVGTSSRPPCLSAVN